MLSPGNSESIQPPLRRGTGQTGVNTSHLPEEIVLEVFLYLDANSILAMKNTCRAFYYTSKSRQLWYKLVRELEAQQICRLEGPLEEYSTEELERWVLRRLRAQALWNSSTPPVVYQYPLHNIRLCLLSHRSIVPGGRWLLVLKHGEVYAVDLNSSRLEGRPLFHLGADYGGGWLCGRFKCDYWIDDTKPQLSFRVGVWGGSGDNTNRGPFKRIALYQVELSGHGSSATLVAEPLKLLTSLGTAMNFGPGCLNAEYFVEFHNDYIPAQTRNKLRSYRYNTNGVQREGGVKPFVLLIDQLIRHMEFISDNRIIVFGDYLQIFIISPSENDMQHTTTLLHTIPSSEYPKYSSSLSFSRLCRTPYSTYKMVVFSDYEVRGIEIPDQDPSATVITKLGDQEYYTVLGARAAVGLSAGVIVHDNGTMDFLSYSWGRGENVTFRRTSRAVGLYHTNAMVLSEDLAQIVVTRGLRTTLAMVLDCSST